MVQCRPGSDGERLCRPLPRSVVDRLSSSPRAGPDLRTMGLWGRAWSAGLVDSMWGRGSRSVRRSRYISGERHSHLMLTGNVTFDLVSAEDGRPPRVTPFVVVGAGLFQTREAFSTGPFTSTEGSFTAGGGVRVSVNDRLFVAGDVRLGWETHIRISGAVGVQARALSDVVHARS